MSAEPNQYLLPYTLEHLCVTIWRTKLRHKKGLWIWVWPSGDAQGIAQEYLLCISNSFRVLRAPKSWSKPKTQPKKDKFEVPPHGVDQLLHVNQL